MDLMTFIALNELYGRIIRNGEFTDSGLKKPATRQYLRYSIRIFMLYINLVSEIIDRMKDGSIAYPANWDAQKADGLRYVINRLLLHSLGNSMLDQIGSESLIRTYEAIADAADSVDVERLFMATLLFDLFAPGWGR